VLERCTQECAARVSGTQEYAAREKGAAQECAAQENSAQEFAARENAKWLRAQENGTQECPAWKGVRKSAQRGKTARKSRGRRAGLVPKAVG
jgi:hypothetical protein